MKYRSTIRLITTCLTALLFSTTLQAGEVKIAVAANFTAAMKEIAQQFEKSSGHTTSVSYGSTGKLYTQILHNAPFEVFLAADRERPQLLQEKQLAQKPFTYAVGKLALWSSDEKREVSEAALKRDDFDRIALANPKTAPYGVAAVTVMQRLGVDEKLKPKQVRGDNLAQTYQFVATGNAQLGFVAYAQIVLKDSGSSWVIPQTLYDPIRQDAVLLEKGKENEAAIAFLAYLQSDEAQQIIEKYGYAVEAEPVSN
jgi:molybdate transport system substrate-binding protein